MRHIIWDWNGTLFHDIDAVVDATNEIFEPYGLDRLTVDAFHAVYQRPIWVAYEQLLGRPLQDGEWERLDAAFHDSYHRRMADSSLTADAESALTSWEQSGGSQSLLSMWVHERLVPAVAEFGIGHHFARVDGLQPGGVAGGHKAEHMARHLAALGIDSADVLVVGDTVDDADAARHVGAQAVLYSGGVTGRAALEAVGVPVVDSLMAALGDAENP